MIFSTLELIKSWENSIKTLPLACVFWSCVRAKTIIQFRVAEMVKNIKGSVLEEVFFKKLTVTKQAGAVCHVNI